MRCGRDLLPALLTETGIDIGYDICGAIDVCSNDTQQEFQRHVGNGRRKGFVLNAYQRLESRRHVADMDG